MTEQDKRWIRWAGPGAFRGEGEWRPYTGDDEYWEFLRATLYLPTWVGAEPPTDEQYLEANNDAVLKGMKP